MSIHTDKLALFSKPPFNTAEEKIYYEDITPSYFNKNSLSAVTFHVDKEPTDYIDLGKSELHVKLSVKKDDGTPFDTSKEKRESVLPIDMILHTMWSSVEVYLNKKLVSSSGTDYAYKSAIETHLNYNHDSKMFQLYSIGFSGEDGRNPQATHPVSLPMNYGLKVRGDWFGQNLDKTVEFIGPINADICNQNRLILNEVTLDIKLYPSKEEFKLICGNLEKGKLVIEEIFFRVCKVSVSPEVRLGHAAALELSPARYPYNKVEIRPLSIDQGNLVANFSNIFEGNVPTKLIVGMVKQKNYLGDFHTNPLDFQHFDIESIGLELGNESIPSKPYRFNFEENEYLDGLLSLYKCSDKVWENTDLGITKEMYQNGLTLIGFNIDSTNPPNLDYIGVPRKGNLNMKIEFRKKLKDPIMLIVYAVFPARVEIDNTRLVTTYDVKTLIDEIKQNNIESVKSAIAPAA